MNGWIEAFVPLLAFLKGPEPTNTIPTVWIGVQLVFAIATALWLVARARNLGQRMQEMINLLLTLGPEDLAENYGETSTELGSLDMVGPAWRRFAQTVHREPLPDGQVALYRTVDAQEALSEEAILGRHLNARFVNSVPGLLTSLGILGTFVGLTYGLAQIQGTFDDTGALKEGIGELLKGASIAFSTSVWGILLSVIFSLFEKRKLKGMRHLLASVQDRVNGTFSRRSNEAWLSEISREAGQQTSELKRFNTDLAVSIAQALDEKLAARITPAMEKLVSTIDDLRDFKEESSVDAIEKLVSEFSSSLAEGSSENIQELNGALSGVNATLTRTIETSEQSQRRLEASLEGHLGDLSSKMGSVLSQLTESQQSIQETSNQGLTAMLSQINDAVQAQQTAVNATLTRTTETSEQSQRRLEASLEGHLGDLSSKMESVLSQLTESQQSVQETSSQGLTAMLSQINDAVQTQQTAVTDVTSKMRDELQTQMQTISATVEGIAATVGAETRQVSDHTSARLRELAEIVEANAGSASSRFEAESQQLQEITSGLKVLLNRLENAGEGMALAGETMGEAARPLQQTTDSLRGALETLHATQTQLTATISQTERSTSEHAERIRHSTELVQEAMQSAQTSWTAYSDNFGGLREQLSGVLQELTGSVADYNKVTREGITQYLRDFEGHLERATGTIGGALEGLQEVIDDLNSGRAK
jgi:ABC-type transporter Mla subunit MlaD